MRRFVRRLLRCFGLDGGTTAVEYAVMLALILLLSMAAIRTLGCSVNLTFLNTARSLGS